MKNILLYVYCMCIRDLAIVLSYCLALVVATAVLVGIVLKSLLTFILFFFRKRQREEEIETQEKAKRDKEWQKNFEVCLT